MRIRPALYAQDSEGSCAKVPCGVLCGYFVGLVQQVLPPARPPKAGRHFPKIERAPQSLVRSLVRRLIRVLYGLWGPSEWPTGLHPKNPKSCARVLYA